MSLSETRFGANATALPHPAPLPSVATALSRRAAIFGAVSVAGVSVATSSAAAPSSDAALIDLARQVEVLSARERAASDRLAAAEDAAFTASPSAPVRRDVAGPYADLDRLSTEERYAKLFAQPVDFWAASAAADAEHHAAMAEHGSAVAAIEKRHGVPRFRRQAIGLADKLMEAFERLAEMRATTSGGLVAKARALLAVSGGDPISRHAEFEHHDALLVSLLDDAVRLGAGGLS